MNSFIKKIITLILLSFSISIFSQYETANWYFGNHAGLSFTSGSPVPLSGGQIDVEEGMSTISNSCGNLLFYTDGMTIWNHSHQVVLNGTALMGDSSSTQSSIIIPKPNNTNIYYIITVDDAFVSPSNNGVRYSILDSSQNNGNGNILTDYKNLPIVMHASEKIAAVHAHNGNDIWVVSFAPPTTDTAIPYNTNGNIYNTFYAIKIGTSGIVSSVVSPINISVDSGAGYMKIAPNGTKIAIANMLSNTAYIFDFDNTTGIVSNPVELDLPTNANEPYGVEFSPDSSKLYISDKGNYSEGALIQYDLSNANTRQIISERQNYRSALQLAPNGKIYQTHTTGYGNGTNTMSVIDNPNIVDNGCNYRYRFINLGSAGSCHQGLPSFIASNFEQQNISQIVSNSPNLYEISSANAFTSVDWDFGDGTTETSYPDNAPDNTHTQVTHVYAGTNIYSISAILHLTNGCNISLSTNTLTVPTGINEQFLNKIKIYPNPSNSSINIKIPKNLIISKIILTDLQGRLVKQKYFLSNDNMNLNIQDISQGTYILQIFTNKGIINKQIIKQ